MALLYDGGVAVVRRHRALIESYLATKPGREFHHYYEACRKGMIWQNQSLPKSAPSLSLYATRHQFRVNARLAGIGRTEVAYLMGHASTGTANVTMDGLERRLVALGSCKQ